MADGFTAPRMERDFDLHILDREIAHPSVFLSWCVSPQFYAQRLRIKNKNPLVLLMQVEKTLPNGERIEERYFFDDCLKKLGGLITFPRPGGTWTVHALLVEITNEMHTTDITSSGNLRKKFLERESRSNYYWSFNRFGEYENSAEARDDIQYRVASKMSYGGRVVAYAGIDVTIPDNVYAKPLHPLVQKWVLAYAGEKNINDYDECDIRRRLIFYSAHLQIPHYVVWETLKRLNAVRSASVLFMAGKNGMEVFRRAFASQLVFAHPSIEANHAWQEPSAYWKVSLFKRAKDAIIDAFAKQKQSKLERAHSEEDRKRREGTAAWEAEIEETRRLEQLAKAIIDGTATDVPLAVCGQDDPSLRAKKIARKSILLRIDLTKREVCRPYG